MAEPTIRFRGFDDEWEQRKLGDVAQEFKSGNSLKADEIDITGDYPVYGGNGLRGYTSTYNHDGEYALIGRQGALCGNMNYSAGKAYFTEHAVVVKADENNDTRFLYYMLDTMNLGQYSDQSAQPGLAVNKLVKLENSFPKKEEQQQIGAYFRSLDHLITLHQRKCDETKKLKKYMLQKMFPQNGSKVPEIRFKGFTDEWEQRKLGEVLKERSERANGSEELLSVTIGNGVIKQADSDKRNTASDDKSNYKIVRKGDLPYNSMRMWQGAVGNSEYDGIVSPAYTVLVPTEEANSKFFMELFKKESTLQIFQRWSQGLTSDTWNLKYPALSTIQFYIPSVFEQTKIADYFIQLDHLITLHQRKCDETKKLKKYMLQKMFPQNGSKVPEIRFKGFTDEWEQRKLGEVLKERSERANGSEELLSVTIGNGVIKQADSDKRNTASDDKSNYKIVRKGDLPYNSMRMWQGAVGNSEYDGIVSPAYTVLVPTEEANSKFFMELFKKESTLQIFQRWSQGLTSDTWNLKYPALSTIQFYIPSVFEQTKIADYFIQLDHLITLHQHKCEELKKLKKFMLQNMFTQKNK